MRAVALSVFLFASYGAFALSPIDRFECRINAVRAAHVRLAEDSGSAHLPAYHRDPFLDTDDPANVLSIKFWSSDHQEWIGFAHYKITVDDKKSNCSVIDVQLFSSEGL